MSYQTNPVRATVARDRALSKLRRTRPYNTELLSAWKSNPDEFFRNEIELAPIYGLQWSAQLLRAVKALHDAKSTKTAQCRLLLCLFYESLPPDFSYLDYCSLVSLKMARGMMKLAKRYLKLVQSFGTKAILLLPFDLTDEQWLRYPFSQPAGQQAVFDLYRIEDFDAGLQLAEEVISKILKKLESWRQISISETSSTILTLIHFMGPTPLPAGALRSACDLRKVWNCNGEIDLVRLNCVIPSVAAAFANSDEIQKAEKELHERGWFKEEKNQYLCTSLYLENEGTIGRVSTSMHAAWKLQALLLVCHLFPFTHLVGLFGTNGKILINQLRRVVEYYEIVQDNMTTVEKSRFVEVLIAASRFGDRLWKMKAIETAEGVFSNTPHHLAMEICLRKQQLGLCCQLPILRVKDVWSNAQRGLAIIQSAKTLLMQGKYTEVEAELAKFSPVNSCNPSTAEKISCIYQKALAAKVARFMGRFQNAYDDLIALQSLVGGGMYLPRGFDIMSSDIGWNISCHIAALLCELGQAREAEKRLLVEKEISEMVSLTKRGRLEVALAETFLHLGEYEKALIHSENATLYCITTFERPRFLTTRILFAKALALSKLERFREAVAAWERVKTTIIQHGWIDGFFEFVSHRWMGYVYYSMGKPFDAVACLSRAAELARVPADYTITGLGTKWLTDVEVSLASIGSDDVCIG